MSSVLFYNVGQSDIIIEGETKDNFRLEFREKTKSLLQKIQEDNKKLFQTKIVDLPILKNTLKFLEKEGIKFNKVILFATDQEGKYSYTDTIYVAEIFKIYLEIKYKVTSEIIEIKDNPQDYDKMLEAYKGFLADVEINNNLRNIIVLAPGTPAMTLALMLNSLPFIEKTISLYVSLSGEVKSIRIMQSMVQERWTSVIENLLKDYDYQAAAEVLNGSNLPNHSHAHLFMALHNRFNFKFDKALKSFEKYFTSQEPTRELIKIQNSFLELNNPSSETLLKELYYNIQIKLKKENYLEAVALMFRLQEGILTLLVEQILNTKIEKKDGKFASFVEAIEKNSDLKTYLINKVDYQKPPNRLILTMILHYYQSKLKGKIKERIDSVLEFSEKLGKIGIDISDETSQPESLGDLRNACPYGHGFRGVSLEDIKKVYSGDIETDISNFVKLNLSTLEENPFDLANELAFRKLRC